MCSFYTVPQCIIVYIHREMHGVWPLLSAEICCAQFNLSCLLCAKSQLLMVARLVANDIVQIRPL